MSMTGLRSPPSLYSICLDLLIPLVERVGEDHDWDEHSSGPLDKFAAAVLEDLLLQTYHRATAGKSQAWSDDWKVLITPKSQSLVLAWDQNLLRFVNCRCKAVKQILVGRWKRFSPASLNWLPASVVSVDFDGELFYRGRQGPLLNFSSNGVSHSSPMGWLQEAAAMLKSLYVWRQKSILNERSMVSSGNGNSLVELHLGAVPGVTAEDLVAVLRSRPGLRLLRHYQLLTALKLLHGDDWRNGERLPKYRLRNLDMDFSHVVRCRMSPEAVLPVDVLQLGLLVCPDVVSVRVRFDPLTSHDVLSPLATMLSSGLRELSVVCVTSGEKSRLDFSDLVPIFEKHGSESLRSLELKVMEDVDVHVIVELCPKLERLVLSGCGNLMPPTCSNGRCGGRALRRLKRLKLLFFVDGDDFSWDHAVPQCFWKSTLAAGGKKKPSHSRLEGIFLESPRIPSAIADEIFRPGVFPALQVLSLCRYPELRMQDIAGLCGLDLSSYGAGGTSVSSQIDSGGPPRYVRLTDCEQVGPRQERILRNMLKHAYPLQEVRLVIS